MDSFQDGCCYHLCNETMPSGYWGSIHAMYLFGWFHKKQPLGVKDIYNKTLTIYIHLLMLSVISHSDLILYNQDIWCITYGGSYGDCSFTE